MTDPPIPHLPAIDYIYFATGAPAKLEAIGMLASMREHYPIRQTLGLPCLNDELMWRDDVPLFVAGKLAALQIGPGAANLSGARVGAERIVWGLEEALGRWDPDNAPGPDLGVAGDDCVRCNKFDSLAELASTS
ncbi:MAG: hypothetical protein INR71_03575 [Terriglobus roseus]|nr:hypothetical protein [Terriglobus roseus]